MQRPSLLVLVLVVLVALAGCNGFLGGTDPTPHVTPAAVPTEPPVSPTETPQLAPGLTNNGLTNVTALLVAHNATLRNTSFTKQIHRIDLYTNGSVSYKKTSVIRVSTANNGYYRITTYSGLPGSLSRFEAWTNGELTLTQSTYTNNTTRYTDQLPYDQPRTRAVRPFRLGLLVAGEPILITPENSTVTYLSTRTVTHHSTRNGTDFYRIRSLSRAGDHSYLIQLVVDSRGLIHEYSIITRTIHRNSPDAITIIAANYTQIGTTAPPDRPSWYPTARTATAPNATNQQSS